MSEIVLFHHVLGLTGGVADLAQALTQSGHVVHTPDLFEGQVFPDVETGFSYVQEVGFDTLNARAVAYCETLPLDVVYAGLSLGVMVAQQLFQTRPGGRGGIFLHSFVEPTQLPGEWPLEAPVHVHAMDADPFFVDDGDYAAAQAWQVDHPNLHIHTYPGDKHLFTDATSRDYDEAATLKVLQAVATQLAELA